MLWFLKSLHGIQENYFFPKNALCDLTLPFCPEMISNSIGFNYITFVTTVCDMVTVGLTMSEKSPGHTNTQTNKLTSKRTRTKRL